MVLLMTELPLPYRSIPTETAECVAEDSVVHYYI